MLTLQIRRFGNASAKNGQKSWATEAGLSDLLIGQRSKLPQII
jgi:hypothetical protein